MLSNRKRRLQILRIRDMVESLETIWKRQCELAEIKIAKKEVDLVCRCTGASFAGSEKAVPEGLWDFWLGPDWRKDGSKIHEPLNKSPSEDRIACIELAAKTTTYLAAYGGSFFFWKKMGGWWGTLSLKIFERNNGGSQDFFGAFM